MDKKQVSTILEEIGTLLELKGENFFKSRAYERGGRTILSLSEDISDLVESGEANFKLLYPDEMGLTEKIETIATQIYGADGVDIMPAAQKTLDYLTEIGMGTAPVCIAKTQYSFSDNPALLGRPKGFRITVREVTPSAGAGFVVVKTGDVMTMPGLAAVPAAVGMSVGDNGEVVGLA